MTMGVFTVAGIVAEVMATAEMGIYKYIEHEKAPPDNIAAGLSLSTAMRIVNGSMM
jgi:hypothetical protein